MDVNYEGIIPTEPEVIFNYRGHFTYGDTLLVLKKIDQILLTQRCEWSIQGKLFYVSMEVLQNLQRHSLYFGEDELLTQKPFFEIRKNFYHYTVVSENTIYTKSVPNLQQRLITINAADRSELKGQIKKTLLNDTFTEKGGANLGLLCMALKSGSTFIYSFKFMSSKVSSFRFKLSIPVYSNRKF